MSSDTPRTLRDDLRELQARLAVRTAELDQVQKTLADQEGALQRLDTRRVMRAWSIARYMRSLTLSACLFAGIILVLIAQSHGWVVVLGAMAFLLSSGVLTLRKFYTQRQIVRHATAEEGEQPSVRLSTGDEADQPRLRSTVDSSRSFERLDVYRQYGPGNNRNRFVREFILAAAHENGGRLDSCAACREICQTRWGLELEISEISVAVRQLIEDEQLLEEGTYFRLSRRSSDEVAKRVRVSNELEATAFSEWEAAVRSMAPSLDHQQMTQLHKDLTVWIRQIIIEHGIEAALVLDPENELFSARLEEIRNFGFEFLPVRDPQIMLERPTALRAFLDSMTSIQRRYFDSAVATAGFVSEITLEPATLGKVRELLSGQRLYLDSNVVYSLLKLNGPGESANTRRVLDLSRRLGYQVCITPWTIVEMEQSVRAARTNVARAAPCDQVQGILNDENAGVFVKTFRHLQRETGMRSDDLFVLYEQIRSLLIDDDIEVVIDGCPTIDDDDNRIKEQVAALERIGHAKSRVVYEYDAKHRLLIERLRGEGERSFSNAGFLMLTNDQTLIRYADASRECAADMPFAVSVHGWAHIVRSLTPRTEDYDMMMTRVLDTPSLRREGVSRADVVDAIARIDRDPTHSETFGERALLDVVLNLAREATRGGTNHHEAIDEVLALRLSAHTQNRERGLHTTRRYRRRC